MLAKVIMPWYFQYISVLTTATLSIYVIFVDAILFIIGVALNGYGIGTFIVWFGIAPLMKVFIKVLKCQKMVDFSYSLNYFKFFAAKTYKQSQDNLTLIR